jgi:hypothetical protein
MLQRYVPLPRHCRPRRLNSHTPSGKRPYGRLTVPPLAKRHSARTPPLVLWSHRSRRFQPSTRLVTVCTLAVVRVLDLTSSQPRIAEARTSRVKA